MLTEAESKAAADQVRVALQIVNDDVRKSYGKSPEKIAAVEVTCENCGCNDNCEFAFDLYNTDGDCLMEKQMTTLEKLEKWNTKYRYTTIKSGGFIQPGDDFFVVLSGRVHPYAQVT